MDQNLILGEFINQYNRFVDSGTKSKEAYLCVCRQGYKGSRRTLYRHIRSYVETGRVLPETTQKRGRKRILTESEEAFVYEHVTANNKCNITTSNRKVSKAIKDQFQKESSTRTVKRTAKRLKLTKRAITKRGQGVKKTREELGDELWDMIKLQKRNNVFSRSTDTVFSVDVTTTKPPEKEFTWLPRVVVSKGARARSPSTPTLL